MKLSYLFIGLLLLVGAVSAASPVGVWKLEGYNVEAYVNADGTGSAVVYPAVWFLPPVTDTFKWAVKDGNVFTAVDYFGRTVTALCDGEKITSPDYPQYTLVRKD